MNRYILHIQFRTHNTIDCRIDHLATCSSKFLTLIYSFLIMCSMENSDDFAAAAVAVVVNILSMELEWNDDDDVVFIMSLAGPDESEPMMILFRRLFDGIDSHSPATHTSKSKVCSLADDFAIGSRNERRTRRTEWWWRRPIVRNADCLWNSADSFVVIAAAVAAVVAAFAYNGNVFECETKSWYANGINDDDEDDDGEVFCVESRKKYGKKNEDKAKEIIFQIFRLNCVVGYGRDYASHPLFIQLQLTSAWICAASKWFVCRWRRVRRRR